MDLNCRVLKLTEAIGNHAVFQDLEVSEKYVRRWQKDEEKFICMPKFKHINSCATTKFLELK